MGIVHKTNINSCWSQDKLYNTPNFSKVMPRDRFKVNLRFLHINENARYNAEDADCDRLHKVRPLLDLIRKQYQKVYGPGRFLSVDESLVLLKDRVHFCQNIKTKRARFGLKLYELTTSHRITLDVLVYCGTGMFFSEGNEHEDMPATERIPVELTKSFLDKGHVLYTDNFCTSPMLASFLLQNQTFLFGTVKKNCKHCYKDISNVIFEKGTASFFQTSNVNNTMFSCKYRASKDKAGNKPKVVFMMSTFHNPFMVHTGKVDRDKNHIMKPAMVQSYNVHMGSMDRVDQQLHGIHTLRKSYKW